VQPLGGGLPPFHLGTRMLTEMDPEIRTVT
jgi:hypothetical protein